MSQDELINLDEHQFIASGAFFKCFEHPQYLSQCIKVSTLNKKTKKRHRADLKYYRKLHKQEIDLKFIADYLGECKTTLGTGYIYQCVRDHNEQVSQTLEEYLKEPHSKDELQQLYTLFHNLAIYLVKNKILINDLHARNILIQVDSVGNKTPIIVDGIGDRVAITALNVIPSLLTAKIIRRWNRFARKELDSNALLSIN